MNFKNIFKSPRQSRRQASDSGAGDYRSGMVYLFNQDMELAISAAAATQRPLLITGPAGCGKTALARNTAHRLKWRYLERTINSRTEITSLLWELDHVKRLQDAQNKVLDPNLLAYVRPSVLWQALDEHSSINPLSLTESSASSVDVASLNPAVVLVDEIDKADPDLPNNLLEVLGGLHFEVADSGHFVSCKSGIPLIMITSNDERDLPPAFVRRCISLVLEQPDLEKVAQTHFPDDDETIEAALELLESFKSQTTTTEHATGPSAAEFLDFIVACKELQVGPASKHWQELAKVCMLKGRRAGLNVAASASLS